MSEIGTKKETRVAYGETLVELGAMNEKVVVMDADLSGSTKTAMFKKAYPDRFFNAGIAEGNMVGVAAGLAASGYTVFVSSFAMFASGRAFEQIRNTAAYPNLNVKICASHAGITVGADGATHQCLEDIGIMRTIPHMTVINPADAVEARLAILAAAKHNGPVYMRFGRSAVPVVFDADTYKFDIGKGVQLVEGSDVTLVATGITVEMALEASEILKSRGISARVINMATIKPIDREILVKASRETGVIVTSEEHNIIGGLGSAVCEALCEEAPCIVERVGIRDSFGRSGSVNDLLKYYKLTAEEIVSRAEIALQPKQKAKNSTGRMLLTAEIRVKNGFPDTQKTRYNQKTSYKLWFFHPALRQGGFFVSGTKKPQKKSPWDSLDFSSTCPKGTVFRSGNPDLVQLSVSISRRLYQLSAGRTNRPVKRRVPFSSFRV